MFRQKYSSKTAKSSKVAGRHHDSRFEAGVAEELEKQLAEGSIKGYEAQYKVEMWVHRPDGLPAFKVSHKVDFRIHHLDDSYELVEAKGRETEDYRWRRKILEEVWLPMNLDHIYTVVKQRSFYRA